MREAEQVGRALNGRKSGRGWICYCPAHENTKTPALSVSEGTDGRLLVKCHAGCDGGSVIAELQRRGIIDGKGHETNSPNAEEIARRKAEDRRKEQNRLNVAHDLFDKARSCEGTIAQTYLEEVRGISGLRFNRMRNTLRFHPNALHTPSGQHLPAIIARIRAPHGRALGVHRTFLMPDGSDKADVTPAKMMLGPSSGGAVRFGRDASIIALAEGIETALSVCAASRLTTWATLSTSGLTGLILPPAPVGEVVILCADNDEAGISAAENTAARLENEGRVVSIIYPKKVGDDFNDVLRDK